MKRHSRDTFFVVGEGVLSFDAQGKPTTTPPTTLEEMRRFRFSRLGPKGTQLDEATRTALASAMTSAGATDPDSVSPTIPAGFTYLGQFVDHDLTMDRTAVALGQEVTVDDLIQGRSPALDLDSLYGRGPLDSHDKIFYAADGVKLKTGTTSATTFPDQKVNVDLEGFDLPRSGAGSTKADRRAPLIPDSRNDENLPVAQTHGAFIRFHNRVADEMAMKGFSGPPLFIVTRQQVVKHYQWMLRTDFLPRIVDQAIVEDVFTNGRRHFDVSPRPGDQPTMPIEFSVASYRLGHSMVRGAYQWNRVFNTVPIVPPTPGPGGIATLLLLFTFTGVNGNFTPGSTVPVLDDPNSGGPERLPTNWIVDFRRLYDFGAVNRPDLVVRAGAGNVTKKIDTLLVNPLADLPAGSFAGRGTNPTDIQRNLAFRNLTRAFMVQLATGQQMAQLFGVKPLTRDQIITGSGGASLSTLTDAQKDAVATNTPLWFYILREAELNGGRLTGVGGRIVVEVFHRAMEGSNISIVRDRGFRPSFGPDANTFRMIDLLLLAFEGKAELLNPLGD